MALDNTSGSGKDAVKESNDSGSAAQAMAEEANQTAKAQEQSRQAGRQEMQSVTGSDFQIVDQSNGGKQC